MRYFNYLVFLPLFIGILRMYFLVFLLYDYIETEISKKLEIDKPNLNLKRKNKDFY